MRLGPCSRYAPLTPPPPIAGAVQRDETGRSQYCLVDRCVGMLLEHALEPPSRDPRVPARILPCDQHGQLKRVEQTQLRQFFGRIQGAPGLAWSLRVSTDSRDRRAHDVRVAGHFRLGPERERAERRPLPLLPSEGAARVAATTCAVPSE
jgi:hypothetical protein